MGFIRSSFFTLSSISFATSVIAQNRTVEIDFYGYSLCQFCFEGANVIGNTLEIDNINENVLFKYLPVNHWNSDGSYACTAEDDEGNTIDLDCEGTAFESCLVNQVCWYGDCDVATQQSLAKFLKCYEGPGANSENELDPSTRQPCLESANFPSPNNDINDLMTRISTCQNDPNILNPILDTLNQSKTEMVASTDYTVFPIFYVNDEYQVDSTWTALTRTLCDLSTFSSIDECTYEVFQLNVVFSDAIDPNTLVDVTALALNLAASNESLPIHFNTDDDALTTSNEFTYVNVEAVIAVIPGKCSTNPYLKKSCNTKEERQVPGLGYSYEFEAEILKVFENDTIDFITNNNDLFIQYFNYVLQANDFDLTLTKCSV